MSAQLLIVCVLLLCLAVACSSGPPQCPTVPERTEEGFDIDYRVRSEIAARIQFWLRDPGSYEEARTTANARSFMGESLTQTRSDGSRYYTELEVSFRSRNGFGGMAANHATVELWESRVEGCVVRDVDVW